MEGGALFNPGFLGGSFLWWVGQIADDSTWRENILPGKFADASTIPGWGRRYKVRIIGLHDQGNDTITDENLPWAQVMYPITAGGGQTNSSQTPNLRQGNFVFGFFLDGQDQQVPVIMGVLGNNAQTALNTSWDKTKKVTNASPGSLATSGYAKGKKPKGAATEKVPDEGKVVVKPKSRTQYNECAPLAPGKTLDKYGLPYGEANQFQLRDIQSAAAEATTKGLTGTDFDNFVKKVVQDGIKNRCKEANSSTSPPSPGAAKENADAVHQTSSADLKLKEKYKEKIPLMKPGENKVMSALKCIQTVLDNLMREIKKYLDAITCYADAVSNLINSIQKLIAKAACIIAKYMKIIFDKIMEYVLKLLNKELTKVVSAMPSSMRSMFGDMKEILVELIMCLYNKITQGLCGLIQGLLTDILKPNELEQQMRNSPSNRKITPSVPICYAEQLAGQVISFNKQQINDANNTIIDNVNAFLDDIQGQIAGVSGSLADITSNIGNIGGSLSDALSFTNLKLNVFGCELKPNVAVSDFYTFGRGGGAQPDAQLPSEKGVENAATQPVSTTPTPEVPYLEPTKASANVDLKQ
ncbi:MAG: hypothetical protein EBU90_08700 [Proteobacteria bacterium]|jgi:hypothetical protein|nr:hypothetical protein [Pseudomonadota bacterium]